MDKNELDDTLKSINDILNQLDFIENNLLEQIENDVIRKKIEIYGEEDWLI